MARPIRLSPAAERQLVKKLGTALRDPVPRKVRIPHPEYGAGLDTQLRAAGLPPAAHEFRFHPTRKWRYDRAYPEHRLLIEIDGGAWLHVTGGTAHSHGRGAGFERDRKKDAEALLLGYRVLRLTPKMVKSGEALHYIAQLLGYEPGARGYQPKPSI